MRFEGKMIELAMLLEAEAQFNALVVASMRAFLLLPFKP
jgi:hypothetical protein